MPLLLGRMALPAAGADETPQADEPSREAVTEYDETSRLLISLPGEPEAAAHSAAAGRLATGHHDGAIVVWSSGDGRPLKTLSGHTGTVAVVAFDASGQRLVSAGYDNTVRVWNAAAGTMLHTFSGHESRITAVAVSPDGGRVISGGYDRTVRLWDVRDPAAEPLVLREHETTLRAVAFSPDGERFASGDDSGTVRLWNSAAPSDPLVIEAHRGAVRVLAFSSDGRLLASGGDAGDVIVWDAVAGTRHEWSEPGWQLLHGAPVTCVVFGPDGGALASADQRGEVRIWDPGACAMLSLLDDHQDEIVGLGFAPGGAALLSVSRDRTVRRWRARLPATARLAVLEAPDARRLWAVALAPGDVTLFAAGRDGFLAAWDLSTGTQARRFEGFDGTIDAIALSPEGTHIACCGWREETVVVFDTRTGEKSSELQAGTNVRCVRFSPGGGTLVAGGEDGTLKVWSWPQPDEPRTVRAGPMAVYDVAFSPDGAQLAAGNGDWRKPEPGEVTLWDTGQWAELRRLTGHEKAVRAVGFSADGSRLASTGEGGRVIVWHGETYGPLARLQNPAGARPVAHAPDSARVAVGLHDGTINVWDVERGEVVQRFRSEGDVFGLSYSRDGSVLFSVSGEGRIEIWPATGVSATSGAAGAEAEQAGDSVTEPMEVGATSAQPGQSTAQRIRNWSRDDGRSDASDGSAGIEKIE